MTIIEFPTSDIALRKAAADQTYLLDVLIGADELMERSARVVGHDSVRTTPQMRVLLGTLADWMRLYQQTLDQLEQEIKDSAA